MSPAELVLVDPSESFRDSYRSLVQEFMDRGEPLVPFCLAFPNDDFAAFLSTLAACARGEGVPTEFAPHSTYWLVRDGREVVGVSNVRHMLTDRLRLEGGHIGYGVRPSARRNGFATELLRQTLGRARAMGLERVLVTCAQQNVASARTILRNGGAFDSEEFIPELGEIVQRYWIDSAL